MSYGFNLEKRKNGVYYFRQTIFLNDKQISRRISLRTKDVKIAKFLAIQMKARIAMIDLSKVKTYEVLFDESQNLKSVKVTDGNDAQNLNEFMRMHELHLAEKHKREIEKLRIEKEIEEQRLTREKSQFSASEHGQELHRIHDELQRNLDKPRYSKKSLTKLKTEYIENLDANPDTIYKYNNLLDKLIAFASKMDIHTADCIDRNFSHEYILHLRKNEKKTDNTIRNILRTHSSFINHLKRIGEYKEENPFAGQKLKNNKTEPRQPFTTEEINKIFLSEEIKSDECMFFICLLLLTTGARPNEVCQLWTDDIYINDDGIYEISFKANEERQQTLKTNASQRQIYLNELLIRFGFIDYLKNRKNLGKIFDLKKPQQKNWATFFSEKFSKLLRKIGIEKKTLYCFRHTVTNRLVENEIKNKVSQDLIGHEGETTIETVYQRKHKVRILKEATEEILSYKEVPVFAKQFV